MLILAIVIYAGAMLAANWSISTFGPQAAPVNAFLLIGLDLALRDWLHLRLSSRSMLLLILATGALTYALNLAPWRIAAASSTAFIAAALADWLVFARMRGSWIWRANGSNVAGAAVDSLVFPLAAGFSLAYAAPMFVAKVAGGALWAAVLARAMRREQKAG